MADNKNMTMLQRYEASAKLRPAQAKQIPGNPVNMIDQDNKFQEGFSVNMTKGAGTKYTAEAMEWYDEELKTIVVPEGFTPTEEGVTLNRWSPTKKYYTPGEHVG